MRVLPDNLSLTETLRKDSGCTGLAPSFCELLQEFLFWKERKAVRHGTDISRGSSCDTLREQTLPTLAPGVGT